MVDELLKDVWMYAESMLPTMYGNFKIYVFRNKIDKKEHIAIVKGQLGTGEEIPVRIHSECMTSETFGSLKCDCREQLETALRYVADARSGIILYMRQEGRGIGLGNKIKAYALQEIGFDTVEANHQLGYPDDLRRYDVSAAMLHILGVKSVRLLTNNPKKIMGLEQYGIEVVERIPIKITPNSVNNFYLTTKAQKSGHLLKVNDKPPEYDYFVKS